jgi:hypothetical protein
MTEKATLWFGTEAVPFDFGTAPVVGRLSDRDAAARAYLRANHGHADVVEFGGNPLLPDSGVWRWLLGTAMRGDVPEVCFAVPGGCRWLPWWTLTNAKKSSDLPPGLAETLMLGGAGKPVAEVR